MKCIKSLTYKLHINGAFNEPAGSIRSSNEDVFFFVVFFEELRYMDRGLRCVCVSEVPCRCPSCQFCLFLIILISASGVIYGGDLHSACYLLALEENSLETEICLKA